MAGYSTFEGEIHLWTNSAFMFQSAYWGGPLWFPISQSIIMEDDDKYVVKVKDWLVNKKGLLEFTAYNAEEIEAMGQI